MAVKLEALTLGNLEILDARIEQLFQKHLAVIRSDLQNRPNDPTPRKLTIELACVPIPAESGGDLDEVQLEVSAKSAVPVYKTKAFRLKPSRDGLLFNAEIPEELDQPALM